MKKGLLIVIVMIQIVIAIASTGVVRSLSELAAFLLIAAFVLDRRSCHIKSANQH